MFSSFKLSNFFLQPWVGVTSAERVICIKAQIQRHFWTLTEAIQVFLVCSGWTKRNSKASTAPAGFNVSSSPQPCLHVLIANLTGFEDTGVSLPELTLSEVEWVLALVSESNCVWGIFPSGEKGKMWRSKELNKNKSFLFFLFHSVIANYRLTRLLLKQYKRCVCVCGGIKTWRKH